MCPVSSLIAASLSPRVSSPIYTPLRFFYSNIPFSVVFSSRAEQAGAGACNDNRFRSSQFKNIKDRLSWRDDDFSTAIVMAALYAAFKHHSFLDRSSQ